METGIPSRLKEGSPITTTLHVAVRRFGPFESGIVKQFSDFCRTTGADAAIGITPFDLNPLHKALFQRRELADGRVGHRISLDRLDRRGAGGGADRRPFAISGKASDSGFPCGRGARRC